MLSYQMNLLGLQIPTDYYWLFLYNPPHNKERSLLWNDIRCNQTKLKGLFYFVKICKTEHMLNSIRDRVDSIEIFLHQ